MPQRMTLEIGTRIVQLPLGGTATQVSAALAEFFEEKGISVEGTAEEQMLRFLVYIQSYVASVAKASRKKKKEALAAATIDTEVNTEISF